MQVTLRQFVKNLRDVCNQHNAEQSLSLGRGSVANMEEYKRKVGFIAGVSAAVDIAEKMLRQLEEDDAGQDLPEMGGSK